MNAKMRMRRGEVARAETQRSGGVEEGNIQHPTLNIEHRSEEEEVKS
jgi:hypothetical protein